MSGTDELMVNPNIVSEQLQLTFISSSESQVRIALIDISGRMVSISDGEVSAGENQIGIDVSTLPQGIYSVQAEFNGVVRSARFIKK